MSQTTGSSIGDQRLCADCIFEAFLRDTIDKNGIRGTCFYCGGDGQTLSIGQIAKHVEEVLNEFYTCCLDPLGAEDGTIPVNMPRSIADVIRYLVETSKDVAEDIRKVLEERYPEHLWDTAFVGSPFNPHACYAKKAPPRSLELNLDWDLFEHRLKTETRYFNRCAEELLVSIFEGIQERRATNGRPIIADAGPGNDLLCLYRARVFQNEKDFRGALRRPHVEVGPPPPAAAVAGRMNAAGIAVLYAATTPALALAEVRPPVGSKVLIGRFEVIRPLKLLDLVALIDLADEEGSLFNKSHLDRLQRAQFLRGLSERLSKPVMPNDQCVEYLPTQAVADFLANGLAFPVDGIVYPSVHDAHFPQAQRKYRLFGRREHACNVALFRQAAQVQALDDGEEVFVSDGSFLGPFDSETFERGPDVEYTVWTSPLNEADITHDAAVRLTSIEAYYVNGTRVETELIRTNRFMREKRNDAELSSGEQQAHIPSEL